MEKSNESIRQSGIAVLGSIAWGTHVCLFYKTKQDLIGILAPYFKAGLENNEFCIWITPKSLTVRQAENAMMKAVPNFGEYLKKGQMEITSNRQWYLENGAFDGSRLLQWWMDKLTEAMTAGYAGVRIAGDPNGLDQNIWKDIVAYEEQVHAKIDQLRIIAVCAYNLDNCGPAEIIDIVNNHQLALIGRHKQWKLVKNAERKRAEQKARQYQAQLKSLASQLTLTEERERRRIATELHDRVGQSLAVSKIKLDGLRHHVSPDDPAKLLEEVSRSLGQAIEDTRSLTFDLSSPVLHELGFEAAVAAWLVDKIEQKHGTVTEFEDDRQAKPLDEDVRALLFRNVQELLFNVVKHANAHKVKVSIRRIGSQIRVGVEDDGVGFDPAKVTLRSVKEGGFGLFAIRERLEQLKGHLEIESEPDHGCKVVMTAPLKHGQNLEMGG